MFQAVQPSHSAGSYFGSSFPNSLPNSFTAGLPTELEMFHGVDEASRAQDLEAKFCHNFQCCKQTLKDMHELLQHVEEHHSCGFDMDEPELTHGVFEEDWTATSDYESPSNLTSPTQVGFPDIPSSVSCRSSGAMQAIGSMMDDVHVHVEQPFHSFIDVVERSNGLVLLEPLKMPGPLDVFHNFQNPTTMNSIPDSIFVPDRSQLMAEQPTCNPYPMMMPTAATTPTPIPTTAPAAVTQRGVKRSRSDSQPKKRQAAGKEERPYRCAVPGCRKAYKNPNGLKYHNMHGHKFDQNGVDIELARKPFRCPVPGCGKSYKNMNGLKYHRAHSHHNDSSTVFVDPSLRS